MTTRKETAEAGKPATVETTTARELADRVVHNGALVEQGLTSDAEVQRRSRAFADAMAERIGCPPPDRPAPGEDSKSNNQGGKP